MRVESDMIIQLQVLRLLAAFSIIIIHVTAGQVLVDNNIYLANQIFRFGTPIFLILAGIVISYLEHTRPSKSLKNYYKRRFLNVLIPYFIWSVIYSLFTYRNDLIQLEFDPFIQYMVHTFPTALVRGSTYVHLYFILIMVQLYAIFPLLYRLFEKKPYFMLGITFGMTLTMNGLIYLHNLRVLTLPSLGIPYTLVIFTWVFYFTFGLYVYKNEQRLRQFFMKRHISFLLFIMWIASLWLVLVDGKLTKTYWISTTPSNMLYGILSFLLLYILIYRVKLQTSRMKPFFRNLILRLANYSFLIYLVHPMSMGLLIQISILFNKPNFFLYPKGVTLLFIGTITLTFVFIAVIQSTPFAGLLGGNRKKK